MTFLIQRKKPHKQQVELLMTLNFSPKFIRKSSQCFSSAKPLLIRCNRHNQCIKIPLNRLAPRQDMHRRHSKTNRHNKNKLSKPQAPLSPRLAMVHSISHRWTHHSSHRLSRQQGSHRESSRNSFLEALLQLIASSRIITATQPS